MQTHLLQDGDDSFTVSVQENAGNSQVVLFAVGAGGQPERYATLLNALSQSGCTVVAPHFERLVSPAPGEADLVLRARRLAIALDAFFQPGTTAVGVGHSIGATTLLALAGAQMWLGPGRRVDIAPSGRLARLALLAPPTGFFQGPGALDGLQVPILAWVGSEDTITPPAEVQWLAHAMPKGQAVDLRFAAGAGHFSFMDLPPPHVTEPLQNKLAFLRECSEDVCKFLAG